MGAIQSGVSSLEPDGRTSFMGGLGLNCGCCEAINDDREVRTVIRFLSQRALSLFLAASHVTRHELLPD